MVIEWALAVRRGRPREIERAQGRAAFKRRADDFHHIRIGALLVARDLSGDGADIGLPFAQRRQAGADQGRREGRQIALQIDDGLKLGGRVALKHRLEHPVGPADMVGPRHQCRTPGFDDGVAHLLRVGCDHHRATIGFDRAAPDMDDHRLPADIGQGLIGKSCRFQSGGYNDEAGCHGAVR